MMSALSPARSLSRVKRMIRTASIVALLVLTAALGACSSSGTNRVIGRTSKVEVLHILVTNDDGFDAPGIDVVTQALRKLPRAKITVVAPALLTTSAGTKPGSATRRNA